MRRQGPVLGRRGPGVERRQLEERGALTRGQRRVADELPVSGERALDVKYVFCVFVTGPKTRVFFVFL
jgi:hypothetical protein